MVWPTCSLHPPAACGTRQSRAPVRAWCPSGPAVPSGSPPSLRAVSQPVHQRNMCACSSEWFTVCVCLALTSFLRSVFSDSHSRSLSSYSRRISSNSFSSCAFCNDIQNVTTVAAFCFRLRTATVLLYVREPPDRPAFRAGR